MPGKETEPEEQQEAIGGSYETSNKAEGPTSELKGKDWKREISRHWFLDDTMVNLRAEDSRSLIPETEATFRPLEDKEDFDFPLGPVHNGPGLDGSSKPILEPSRTNVEEFLIKQPLFKFRFEASLDYYNNIISRGEGVSVRRQLLVDEALFEYGGDPNDFQFASELVSSNRSNRVRKREPNCLREPSYLRYHPIKKPFFFFSVQKFHPPSPQALTAFTVVYRAPISPLFTHEVLAGAQDLPREAGRLAVEFRVPDDRAADGQPGGERFWRGTGIAGIRRWRLSWSLRFWIGGWLWPHGSGRLRRGRFRVLKLYNLRYQL